MILQIGLLVSWVSAMLAFGAEPFRVISIAELESVLKGNAQDVYLYDINVESTRNHVGIIPQSILLSSSSRYEVKKELPADKKSHLIFYCANRMCTASHLAAKRAIEAGYSNSSVLVDGIYGWKKAGKPIVPVSQARSLPSTEKSSSPVVPRYSGQRVSPQDAFALIQKNQAVIVDVREAEERHEVIASAIWFPMSKAGQASSWSEFKKRLSTQEKNRVAIFHCAVGARSKRIAERLASEGFSTAFFESPDQWKAAGLPVQAGPTQD